MVDLSLQRNRKNCIEERWGLGSTVDFFVRTSCRKASNGQRFPYPAVPSLVFLGEAGQRPWLGTKSCRIGRFSACLSFPLSVRLFPLWAIQPGLKPSQPGLKPEAWGLAGCLSLRRCWLAGPGWLGRTKSKCSWAVAVMQPGRAEAAFTT